MADRPSRRSARVVERNIAVARQIWLIIVSGFFEPVFYLLSIGIGLGHLVGAVPFGGALIPYRQFVAPAMLASSAMNGAVLACTFNIFFRLKYQKTYDAIVSTPVGVGDIVMGEIEWALIRGLFYSVCFLGVMAALGVVRSWWALLAVPVALLIGFAFAGIGMAGTAFMRSWKDFDYVDPGDHAPVPLLGDVLAPVGLPVDGAMDGPRHAAVPGGGRRTVTGARSSGMGAARPPGLPRRCRLDRGGGGVAPAWGDSC